MNEKMQIKQRDISFIEFLDKYKPYKHVNKRNEKSHTDEQYKAKYERVLAPNFQDKPIGEYDADEIREIMSEIKMQGIQRGENRPYSDSSMEGFYTLMRKFYRMAVENGYCAYDVMEGQTWESGENTSENPLKEEMLTLRKSLTVSEEKAIYKYLMMNPKQDGELFGVLLMFVFGLRNTEACAANFDSIKEMVGHPGHFYLEIKQSMVGGTEAVKKSGKTANANRRIPIPAKVYEYLMRRKAYVTENMGECIDLSALPIACRVNDFRRRCTVRRLGDRGKAVLQNAVSNKTKLTKTLRYIQESIEYAALEEKDATAYLFRRNFATHLYTLGLDENEIQYIIGHKLENTPNLRNFFTNEEKLYPIKCKMDKRPLFSDVGFEVDDNKSSDFDVKEPTKVLSLHTESSNQLALLNSEHSYCYEVMLSDAGNAMIQVNAQAEELTDNIQLRVGNGSGFSIQAIIIDTASELPGGPVNITKMDTEQYPRYFGAKTR